MSSRAIDFYLYQTDLLREHERGTTHQREHELQRETDELRERLVHVTPLSSAQSSLGTHSALTAAAALAHTHWSFSPQHTNPTASSSAPLRDM